MSRWHALADATHGPPQIRSRTGLCPHGRPDAALRRAPTGRSHLLAPADCCGRQVAADVGTAGGRSRGHRSLVPPAVLGRRHDRARRSQSPCSRSRLRARRARVGRRARRRARGSSRAPDGRGRRHGGSERRPARRPSARQRLAGTAPPGPGASDLHTNVPDAVAAQRRRTCDGHQQRHADRRRWPLRSAAASLEDRSRRASPSVAESFGHDDLSVALAERTT